MTDRTAVMGSFSLCSYSAPVFNLIAESGRFDGKAAKRLGSSAIAAGWSTRPNYSPVRTELSHCAGGFFATNRPYVRFWPYLAGHGWSGPDAHRADVAECRSAAK